MKTLDCRGQKCPQPVIQARQSMLAEPEIPIRVLVDDQICQENITRLAKAMGYDLKTNVTSGAIEIDLFPNKSEIKQEGSHVFSPPKMIFVTSDQMGEGDSDLGQVLMKNFFFTLLESNSLPEGIFMVNGGVKLAVKNSEILEVLEELANRGVDIASCGLCLEFFGLTDHLAVGRVSNMLELVNSLSEAGNIIRL